MASSILDRNYNVFLSFRGADVRNMFLSHLYSALARTGIHTFVDSKEIWKGQRISAALMKAIQESRIAIIVFSEGYASSAWCLEELVKIMECKEENGLMVIPVFYKVEPREVRAGRERYKEAMCKHESKLGKDSEVVNRWKKALYRAGSLSGWEFNDGDEAEFIQRIVKELVEVPRREKPLSDAGGLSGQDLKDRDEAELIQCKVKDSEKVKRQEKPLFDAAGSSGLDLKDKPGHMKVQAEISLPDENGRLAIFHNHADKRRDYLAEISLPDENGRLAIFHNNTNKMRDYLADDVSFRELAARTKNYTGAEIEAVVRSAQSYALFRQLDLNDLRKPLDEKSIEVTMDDFSNALQEIVPAFGASTNDLERCRLNGIVSCGEHRHIYKRAMLLVEQVKESEGSPLVTCLLEGPSGSGKTALAATVGIDSDFPFVKIVSAEAVIGSDDITKHALIKKVFEDAYKSSLSIIILDDLERLLEYVATGPRFSNLISQTLSTLLKKSPPKGKKLLVIGTTSEVSFLNSVGVGNVFSVTHHVPTLKTEDAKEVLEHLNVFSEDDIQAAAEALNDMPIKKLFMLIDMAAAKGEQGGAAGTISSGREKIKMPHFYDCLKDIARE